MCICDVWPQRLRAGEVHPLRTMTSSPSNCKSVSKCPEVSLNDETIFIHSV